MALTQWVYIHFSTNRLKKYTPRYQSCQSCQELLQAKVTAPPLVAMYTSTSFADVLKTVSTKCVSPKCAEEREGEPVQN